MALVAAAVVAASAPRKRRRSMPGSDMTGFYSGRAGATTGLLSRLGSSNQGFERRLRLGTTQKVVTDHERWRTADLCGLGCGLVGLDARPMRLGIERRTEAREVRAHPLGQRLEIGPLQAVGLPLRSEQQLVVLPK